MRHSLHLRIASLLLGTLPVPMAAWAATPDNADIIIRGGTIYTGEAAPFRGDVAIKGDRIIYVGPHAKGKAERVIDAKGLIVSPGFIDPHTHIDNALFSSDPPARLVLPFITQGVTTAFIGVDGQGAPDLAARLSGSYAAKAQEQAAVGPSKRDMGVNVAAYVGLAAVRGQVIGLDDRAPNAAELQKMVGLVDQAMCAGALGFSTGLFYAPQSYAKRDEVVALAKAAAARGGVYDSHIRDESSYTIGLKGAIEEALEIGREAKIPVHIAHIKALGIDVQGEAPQVIKMIEDAQAAGEIVTADQYPWSASGTGLDAALLPRWAQDGGREATIKRFDDAATLARIRKDMAENLRRRGGPAALLITSGPAGAEGKTLEAIARETGADPIDAAIAILRKQRAMVASFNQSEPDIATFMKRPWVVTSSDASLGHPRYYSSFANKYAKYVKEKKVIDTQTFIRQSTTTTARMFGLKDRGVLKEGAFADVIAFDPANFHPRADYAHPFRFSTGMRFVIVNGAVELEDGEPTGVANGTFLRHEVPGGCE